MSKHQIRLSAENERADVASRLSGAKGETENTVFPVQLTTSRIGSHTG